MKQPLTVGLAVMVALVVMSLATGGEAWKWGRRHRTEAERRHGRPARDREDRHHGRGRHHRGKNNWWQSFFKPNDLGTGFTFGNKYTRRYGIDFNSLRPPFDLDFDFDLRFGRKKDWWRGPNVCESKERQNSNDTDASTISHHFKYSTHICEGSDTAYKCTTTQQSSEGEVKDIQLFECCHGFSREQGDFGCPAKLVLEDLPAKARSLGLNDLLRAVTTVGLEEDLTRGNFTIFAPVDGAFPLNLGPGLSLQDEPRAVVASRPLGEKMERELQAVLLGHLLPEPRRMSSVSDEDVLVTASPVDSTIRVNFYSRPEKLTTANCVKVRSSDHLATNGVIHVVEKVLPTVTSSLLDLVQKDDQLSSLKTALARVNLVSTLKQDGQLTLLAPTNAAFRRLDPALLDSLLSGDPQCLHKVLKQHLLPNVICSAVIQGRAKTRNLLDNFVNFTRTDDGKLFAGEAQVVRFDVMATNGVMHIIDSVLVPDDALDVMSVARKVELSEFADLTVTAGMTKSILNYSDVTIFAPSNEAIQALSPEVRQQLQSDPDLLTSVLSYHVVPEQLQCRQLYNGRVLDTLNPKGKIFVGEFSSFPFGHKRVTTVQCAPIITRNIPACNGVIHVLDRVMLPPAGNVVDVLAANSNYTTMVRLLKKAGLADSLQDDGALTVFAPTNEAFSDLGKKRLQELEDDARELTSLLKRHIVKGHLCCAGIFGSSWWRHQTIYSISGHSMSLLRDRRGQPFVSDAVIGSCDNTATNGVVHGIETVLMRRRWNPWFGYP